MFLGHDACYAVFVKYSKILISRNCRADDSDKTALEAGSVIHIPTTEHDNADVIADETNPYDQIDQDDKVQFLPPNTYAQRSACETHGYENSFVESGEEFYEEIDYDAGYSSMRSRNKNSYTEELQKDQDNACPELHCGGVHENIDYLPSVCCRNTAI